MKERIVIIFLLLISLLAAETTKANEQINVQQRPLYEKVPIIRDYRLNQPIKGVIRWSPIGFGIGYVGASIYYYRERDHTRWNLKEASGVGWKTCKISMLVSALYGLYKGSKAQNQKKNDPSYFIDRNKIGYEGSLMLDPFIASDARMNKVIKSITLTYNHQYRFMDEFQLGIDWVRWPDLEETRHIYEEIKYDLRGIHYNRKDHIVSPYYGLGGGLSYGKRRHDDWYYDDTKVISRGLYPFIHTSAGLRFSFLDFFYLKMEADFELSSFYFYASSYEDYSFLTNLTFGLVVGTKIF
jgi:hypothetical protein